MVRSACSFWFWLCLQLLDGTLPTTIDLRCCIWPQFPFVSRLFQSEVRLHWKSTSAGNTLLWKRCRYKMIREDMKRTQKNWKEWYQRVWKSIIRWEDNKNIYEIVRTWLFDAARRITMDWPSKIHACTRHRLCRLHEQLSPREPFELEWPPWQTRWRGNTTEKRKRKKHKERIFFGFRWIRFGRTRAGSLSSKSEEAR